MKKKRALLVSCAVIVLCLCIIAGMSYALFSDRVSVGNHLQAGNLKVSLKRTNLEYCVLNSDGVLETKTDTTSLDLTNKTGKNVFGLDSENIRIAPTSYFDATLEIANGGNTAFTYSVTVQLADAYKNSELAKQLKVTVYNAKGDVVKSEMLDKLDSATIPVGATITVNGEKQTFRVRVEFVNDVDYNKELPAGEDRMNNNAAQDGVAAFDLVVSAVQSTTAPAN